MCLLGYPRLLSRENFRSTNFPLVAEILHWFCQRLDPSHGINLNIDTEQDRVIFMTTAVQYLVSINVDNVLSTSYHCLLYILYNFIFRVANFT